MPSRQVRDIVDHVRSYHRNLSQQLDFFDKQIDKAVAPRLEMLINYMARHEQNFEKLLTKYESEASSRVLNTWLKFVPDESVDRALMHLNLHTGMDADEILGVVLNFDKSLIALYRELADETPLTDVHELFTDLMKMEDSKDRQYSLSVLKISDA